MDQPELSTILEAILFGAGRSMTVGEIAFAAQEDEALVEEALSNLKATLSRRRSGALQVSEISGRWIMEVKPSLSDRMPGGVRPDIPQRLMPAAALIAYHQPMSQSTLVGMLGQRAYDHVRELSAMGLISRRRDGSTRRLMTTRRFAEYFGAPDVESPKVRAWFRKQASDAGMTGAELAASLSGGQATIMEYGPSDEEE
ncbi:MAG: SMC-Scp complex subunit ScpB [Candidatus Thermoplasmatota archaeon]|jgi:segregation and condensation protein B|nr:SMC-Scp complex subunit ScpB [Candidatus Thermoplasmatota archaeon]MED5267190.1 SMC-Scp complex subunit ScpB [Candidatus Thermoplasmatota archaeon]|tara:strand:- start:294 stop:890 length:597 start_codon:yes stop_codon:yes gene_type:complete